MSPAKMTSEAETAIEPSLDSGLPFWTMMLLPWVTIVTVCAVLLLATKLTEVVSRVRLSKDVYFQMAYLWIIQVTYANQIVYCVLESMKKGKPSASPPSGWTTYAWLACIWGVLSSFSTSQFMLVYSLDKWCALFTDATPPSSDDCHRQHPKSHSKDHDDHDSHDPDLERNRPSVWKSLSRTRSATGRRFGALHGAVQCAFMTSGIPFAVGLVTAAYATCESLPPAVKAAAPSQSKTALTLAVLSRPLDTLGHCKRHGSHEAMYRTSVALMVELCVVAVPMLLFWDGKGTTMGRAGKHLLWIAGFGLYIWFIGFETLNNPLDLL